jgi:hypothetical protein
VKLLLAFITIAGFVPTIVKWVADGRISIQMAALMGILMTALIAMDRISFRAVIAVISLATFGMAYASDGRWQSFASVILIVLPLVICLLGFYIMFRAFFRKS